MILVLLLVGSIVTQVVGISATRASDGGRRPLPMVLAGAAVTVSVVLMSRALASGLSLPVGYGLWSGAGIGLSALCGVVWFGDRLDRGQVLALLLVFLGVVLVHLGGM